MSINESTLRAQLIELNDTYLSGTMPKIDWAIRLNELNEIAEKNGIDLFNERGN